MTKKSDAIARAAQALVDWIESTNLPVPVHGATYDALLAALALPPDPPCPDCDEMTRQRDHYMRRADELGADNATLCAALETAARCAALEAALEQERFRLAGCGVIADCNTEDALAERLPAEGAYGDSASLRDVERAVRREMALADENAKLREALEASPIPQTIGEPIMVSVHLDCTACRGSGWIAKDIPCHCREALKEQP